MGWRHWRVIILLALTATWTVIVYRHGFGALGARPAALATEYQTEEAWIAGAVARDVVRMCAYADPRRTAPATASSVTLAPVGSERTTFDVRIRVASTGGAVTIDRRLTLRLPHGLWTPEDYLPIARAVLGDAPPVARAAGSEDPALLDALLHLTPATLTQQDARLSTRLASRMLDPETQEDAALLLGVFGLREAAGTFSDWRETLSRMTAHLVIAQASRPPAAGYGLSGRYADVLRLTFVGRGADALARIDALNVAGTPRTLATWNRILRMRVTQDWRVSRDAGPARRETLAERLEFFRARSATIPSPSVLQQLDAEAPGLLGHDDADNGEASDADTSRAPLADWGRIVMHNGVSVQAGPRIVAPRLQAELRELDEIWRATHGTPRPQALGQALNNAPSGCLTSGGPRVLG